MERIVSRHKTFLKTLRTLEKPLKQIKNPMDRDMYEMVRDSLIQRFEYSFEACWKLLKQLLEEKFSIRTTGTTNIFREAASTQLITEEELAILLDMIHDRNQTSHTYKEEIAEEIAKDIPQYFNTMTKIAERLAKNI